MVVGNLNVVTSHDEKLGGNSINLNDVNNFNDMISTNGLVDGGFSSSKFMWCNNRIGNACISERLDRGLLNNMWISNLSTGIYSFEQIMF